MGLFDKDKKTAPTFTSRAEAFNYMFAEQVSKGMDIMTAAEQANKFADIITTNQGLPPTPPKPQNGVEKMVSYIKMVAQLKQENPEVWELVTGAAGGLISGFALLTSPSANKPAPTPQPQEDIDFDKIK
jgi:hypothetical protein